MSPPLASDRRLPSPYLFSLGPLRDMLASYVARAGRTNMGCRVRVGWSGEALEHPGDLARLTSCVDGGLRKGHLRSVLGMRAPNRRVLRDILEPRPPRSWPSRAITNSYLSERIGTAWPDQSSVGSEKTASAAAALYFVWRQENRYAMQTMLVRISVSTVRDRLKP